MISRMLEDSRRRPDLFIWNGPIPEDVLTEWLKARRLAIPEDLRSLLRETGGGDFFESETVLGPFGDASLGDDLDGANSFHQARGLPSSFLLFHTGLFWTVLSLPDQTYVEVDSETYSPIRRFDSLKDWYRCVREDLAPSYGL